MKRRYHMDANERHKISKKMRMRDNEYAGVDSRRRLEHADFDMIHEDHSAIANLPENTIMKAYPSMYDGKVYPDLDDTIGGIDRQMREDQHGMIKHRSKTKY